MFKNDAILSSQGSQIKQGAFLKQWILAGTLGWILGLIANICALEITSTSHVLGKTMANIVSYSIWRSVQSFSGHVALGAGLGIGQWVALKNKFHISSWWILASSAGISLGWLLEQVIDVELYRLAGVYNSGIGGWASFGIVLGLMQWFVIRSRVHHPGWWLIGSLAALILGGITLEVGDQITGFFNLGFPGILAVLIFGIVRETCIGLVLLRLFLLSEHKLTHILDETS